MIHRDQNCKEKYSRIRSYRLKQGRRKLLFLEKRVTEDVLIKKRGDI